MGVPQEHELLPVCVCVRERERERAAIHSAAGLIAWRTCVHVMYCYCVYCYCMSSRCRGARRGPFHIWSDDGPPSGS